MADGPADRERLARLVWLPSSTLVKRVGCYGFQIDGANFSEHIIVRVTQR
jgi:hypothetical protein